MLQEGLLLVISGPSGVGKGTVCNYLAARHPELAISISMTTRPRRKGEEEGENYFFVTEEKFKKLLEEDAFLEWAQVYGNYYGTPREYVNLMLSQGRDVVLEIDTQGAKAIKSGFPQGVFVFLMPPTLDELERRINNRGTDHPRKIRERLEAARQELKEVEEYGYLVINSHPEEAMEQVRAIIAAEKCRVGRNLRLLENLKGDEEISCP